MEEEGPESPKKRKAEKSPRATSTRKAEKSPGATSTKAATPNKPPHKKVKRTPTKSMKREVTEESQDNPKKEKEEENDEEEEEEKVVDDEEEEEKEEDDDDDLRVSTDKEAITKKEVKKKFDFSKLPNRIPEGYIYHSHFGKNYTKTECDFICGVAQIATPKDLLEYDQDRLAQHLLYWWNMHQKNPFDGSEVKVNNEFCKGMVYSWYIRARRFYAII